MLKFDQTTPDDCFRACLYSVLGRDYDWPLPVIDSEWNPEFIEAVGRAGIMIDFYPITDFQPWFPDFVIMSGIAARGHRHAVVFSVKNYSMVHDPHPSRSGLIAPDGWFVARMIQ